MGRKSTVEKVEDTGYKGKRNKTKDNLKTDFRKEE